MLPSKEECSVCFNRKHIYINLSTFIAYCPTCFTTYSPHIISKDEWYVELRTEESVNSSKRKSGDTCVDVAGIETCQAHSYLRLSHPSGQIEKFQSINDLESEDIKTNLKNKTDFILNSTDEETTFNMFNFEEPRPISKFAENLVQDPNPYPVPKDPKLWKCTESGETSNLWLNLSDGHIGGGRKFWDGSGGSNGALNHYLKVKEEKGVDYPLVVKLGTLGNKTIDVYSYSPEEDQMVTDTKLKEHLKYFGIDLDNLKDFNVEKTVAELEADLNKDFDFESTTAVHKDAIIIDNNSPFKIGLKNLGNTCYVNATLQLLCHSPYFLQIIYEKANDILNKNESEFLTSLNKKDDLFTELTRLIIRGFNSYTSNDIKLIKFISLLRQVHTSFNNSEQHDASEFIDVLFDKVIEDSLSFESLRIENDNQVSQLHVLPLTSNAFSNDPNSTISFQTIINNSSEKYVKLGDALLVIAQRFYYDGGEVKKSPTVLKFNENIVDLSPLISNLSEYKIIGDIDEDKVSLLTSMGYNVDSSKKALKHANNNIEMAIEYLTSGQEENLIDQLISIFPQHPIELLKSAISKYQNMEEIMNNLFNEEIVSNLYMEMENTMSPELKLLLKNEFHNSWKSINDSFKKPRPTTNNYKYRLKGAILHVGNNVNCGHYICYSQNTENNEWTVYNDGVVANVSSTSQLLYEDIGRAYVYLFERI